MIACEEDLAVMRVLLLSVDVKNKGIEAFAV